MAAVDFNRVFERRGWWWPANASERNACPGTLTVSPGGPASVAIDGRLGEAIGSRPTLFGWVDGGKTAVTLYRCLAGNEYGVNENTGREYAARYTVVGQHWPPECFERIRSARIWLEGAEEWFGQITPWEVDATLIEALDRLTGTHQEVDFGTGVSRLEVNQEYQIADREYQLRLLTEFGWYPRQPSPIEEVDEWLHDFQLFLMLCRGKYPSPRRVLIETDAAFGRTAVVLGTPWFHTLESRRLLHHELLIPYRDIRPSFSEVFAKMVGKIQGKRSAFNRLRFVLSDRQQYMEEDFLEKARFLDSLLENGTYVDKADFQRMAEVIKSAIPSDAPQALVEALRRRIDNANALSFRERLESTLASFPNEVLDEYGLDSSFVSEVLHTRNKLAHGAALRRPIRKLIPASEKLLVVIGLHVLDQAGTEPRDLLGRLRDSKYARMSKESTSL